MMPFHMECSEVCLLRSHLMVTSEIYVCLDSTLLTGNSSCKAKAFSCACVVILRSKYACIKVREVKIGEMTEVAVGTLKPIIPVLIFILSI